MNASIEVWGVYGGNIKRHPSCLKKTSWKPHRNNTTGSSDNSGQILSPKSRDEWPESGKGATRRLNLAHLKEAPLDRGAVAAEFWVAPSDLRSGSIATSVGRGIN